MSPGVELFSANTAGGRLLYGQATPEHVVRCAALLSELGELVSVPSAELNAKPIFVRLAHYEHGSFLNPMLFGTSIISASGRTRLSIIPPEVNREPVEEHVLESPDISTREHPFTYAVVANHPALVQIEATLMTLASLIARREVSDRLRTTGEVSRIDEETSRVDDQTALSVRDLMRSEGWRAAATAVKQRAVGSGMPLSVEYSKFLFTREDLANRAPILRRVYNQMGAAREAIDKSVALASLGMFVQGAGPMELVRFARDFIDVARTKQFMAHVLRDAYVCGNGYLSFGDVPDEDMRLLMPEDVEMDGPTAVERSAEGFVRRHQKVLHLRGAEQAEGGYGVSVLEPFVQLQHNNDLMLGLKETAGAWSQPGLPLVATDWAAQIGPLAERTLAANEEKARQLAPTPLRLRVSVPDDMYMPGYREMIRAAAGLVMVDVASSDSDAKS